MLLFSEMLGNEIDARFGFALEWAIKCYLAKSFHLVVALVAVTCSVSVFVLV